MTSRFVTYAYDDPVLGSGEFYVELIPQSYGKYGISIDDAWKASITLQGFDSGGLSADDAVRRLRAQAKQFLIATAGLE